MTVPRAARTNILDSETGSENLPASCRTETRAAGNKVARTMNQPLLAHILGKMNLPLPLLNSTLRAPGKTLQFKGRSKDKDL